MKVLFVATAFNGLSQRLHRELSLAGHLVSVELFISDEHLIEAATAFNPDFILCPYLKDRIPACIWEQYVCLIVHPGIEGDRGPSSLDWAIADNVSRWGVTLLQASEEMDAGDIWGTTNFEMRSGTKASIYRREVSRSAVKLVMEAAKNIEAGGYKPRRLNYNNSGVEGKMMPFMQQQDRQIDWQSDTTDAVIRKINLSDSHPGVLDEFFNEPVFLFGAKAATQRKLKGKPGEIIASSNGALCRATVDGAVWIRIAKRKYGPDEQRIKLPASQILSAIVKGNVRKLRSVKTDNKAYSDIRKLEQDGVGYLYFDFYNGAMNINHCRQLRKELIALKRKHVGVIVLMGGEDFWSNGINLNSIEAAPDQAQYAWENLNAMNDLVREIIDSPNQITIAAVRNNAGAGGAIMPLACDRVVLRDGVVLNPHYGLMGLYGSEYWTYLLPRKIGESRAKVIMRECAPMLAREALMFGVGDELLSEDWADYHDSLQQFAEELAASEKQLKAALNRKRQQFKAEQRIKPLELYRKEELSYMREAFFNKESEFHARRRSFVYKTTPSAASCRLAIHRPVAEQEWGWTGQREEVLHA